MEFGSLKESFCTFYLTPVICLYEAFLFLVTLSLINLNEKVLITGGTGSFGKAFIRDILNNNPEVTRLVVFSRDELAWELQQIYPAKDYPQLRFSWEISVINHV